MLNRYNFTALTFCLLISCFVFSQKKDSLVAKEKEFDEVVVTGQYSPQNVNKSIYKVEVITQEDIKNRAASTIADILNYNLNFITIPNSSTGDSEASLFGLDSQYFKVLIDNIPMVSDNGMGNSIDLTKINLDNVERIEIVRGSMGVDYGSNSLTGIINIITKKNIAEKWNISGYAQEESVGDEYDWKEKGRHIQSLKISNRISDRWFASVGVNRNDFQGFFNDRQGKRYYENDGKRGYQWLPKEQWNANALIRYSSEKFSAFYKAEYLNELINYYSPLTKYAPLEPGGLYTYSATDRDYNTYRWMHHLFMNATLFNQLKFNGDFSYQKQDRRKRDFIYDIGQRKVWGGRGSYKSFASTEAWYTKGTLSNFTADKIFDFQLGYEFNFIKGFRDANSADIGGIGTSNTQGFADDVHINLDNYDIFATAEIRSPNGISFRPGVRVGFSSKFDPQYSYSMVMKYKVSEKADIRAEFATSNRTPNYDELYTYFVDSNHDVRGNQNLTPETGYSTAIHWDQKIRPQNSNFRANVNLSSIYIDLDDKIELSTISTNPLKYQYINIDKYLCWGLQFGGNLEYNNFSFALGASLFGSSKKITGEINGIQVLTPPDDYLYTFQLNSNINYKIRKWGTTLSLYYKFNGKESQYILNSTTETYYLGKQDDFSMLDASIRKQLFDNKIDLTVGVRNIFDVTNVNTTASQAGAHQEPISSVNFFYGSLILQNLALI